jgi:osmoprotectant transport system ATP-binding protein
MTALLELRHVGKAFAGRAAVRDVTLETPRGRTTVLLGPSGCGKSTLLRLMAGLLPPDDGVVTFDGVPLTPESARRTRQRIGFVVQDGGLFPHLTAHGNVTLLARHLGRPHDWIETRLKDLLTLTRFPADLLDRYPVQLSGGQRQRVSLMRGLLLDPPLLLLDEPLGALDPLIRTDLQADLRRIFRDGDRTVVLVTHDLGEAAFLGDEIVLLREGRVVQRGPYADFIERPAEPFVTQFVNAQRSVPGREEPLAEARPG